MKKLLLLFAAMILMYGISYGQVTVTGCTGAGNGSYTTLSAATAAIVAAQPAANVVITITGNTTEPVGGASLVAGTWATLTIQPSGGAWTISGAATAGTPLVTFNGSDNVTINGGGNLTFSNTTVSSTSGTSTLKLVADATSNTFNNVTFLGSATAANGTNAAIVWISTGTATGNDNNSFQSCKFTAAGSNLPGQCIVANGSTTSTAIENSGIIIHNCEFYDYFQPATGSSAIYASTGNTAWTISNNKIYQTATRTITTSSTVYGIYVVNAGATALGENFSITGNTIGYNSNAGTGTMTYAAGTTAGGFTGINFSASSSSASTNSITSNTISNIQWTSTGASSFSGISSSGLTNTTTGAIFNVTGNSVKNISSVTSTGALVGIYAGYAPTTNINSNTINNISRSGSSSFYGIQYAGASSTTVTINGNNIYDLFHTSTTTTSAFYGMYSGSSPANENLVGNNIYNLTSSATGAQTIIGWYNNTAVGTKTIQNNNIYSLSAAGGASIYGIRLGYGTAVEISGNKVYSFSGGVTIYGIYIGAGATDNVFKNKIYDLAGTGAGASVSGIYIAVGSTLNIYNNLIGDLKAATATGLNAINGIYASATATYNIYYNTVYLNATSSSITTFGTSCAYFGTTGPFNLRNNILVNLSTPAQDGSNVATNGISACLRRSSGTTGTIPSNYAGTSNNNDFWCNPTAGTNNHLTYVEGLATITNPYNTVAGFKTFLVTIDQASFAENPTFLSIAGANVNFLHINTLVGTAIESGASNVGITDDYDGNVRQGNPGYPVQVNGGGAAPDVGADEFDGTLIPVAKSLQSISYNQASTNAVPQGAVNQEILRLDFTIIGNSGTLNLNSIVVNSLNTNDADVTSVKLYRTNSTTFSTANPMGSSVTFIGGNATFSSLSYDLPAGTTYVWVAYDVSASATINNLLDAQIQMNKIDVAGNLYPVADQSPTGSRLILNQNIIGTGTATATWPVFRNWNYSTWECIYLQSELGASKDLTKIAFNKSSGTDITAITPVTIYMKHTTATTLSTGKFDLTGYTQVFTGTFPNTATSGWMEMVLSSSFAYNGTDNIQILIVKGNQAYISAYPYYYGTTFATNRARQGYSDTEQPGITGGTVDLTASTNVPNIRIDYTLPLPMSYVSSTTTQNNTGVVVIGSTNQVIIGIQVVTSGSVSPLSATSFTLANNSSVVGDITNARIYYTGGSSTFATTNLFGAQANPPASYPITGGQPLISGTNYFWLAYDISASAGIGNFADAQCNLVIVGGNSYTPTVQDPTGNRMIKGPLAGIYTVGTAKGDYTTLTAAVADLNLLGISDNVNFILTDDTYPSETFPIVINQFTGSSSTKTVTIKPASGKLPVITGTTASATIALNGCDYVIIDGSNQENGTTKDLTIGNTYTGGTFNFAVGLYHNGVKGATNNTIKNCIIKGTPTVTNSYGLFLNAAGGSFHNTSLINNTIKNAKIGIQFVGVSGSVTNNGLISGNIIGDAAQPLLQGGISCGYVDNLTITGNEILGQAAGNSNYYQYGITMGAGSTNSKIRKNIIHDFYYNGTTGYGCFGIYYGGDATTETEISNNVIYAIKGDGDLVSGGTTNFNYIPSGISVFSGGNVKIYYNSINLTGNVLGTSYTGNSSCLMINTSVTLLDIRNNNLKNSMSTVSGTGSNKTFGLVSYSANTAFSNIDFNNYFVNGINPNVGYLTSDRADLAAWKTATGKDANSYSTNPNFSAPTNLQPTAGSYLLGTPIAGITTDINGATRSNPPDIGAYEGSETGRWLGAISTDWANTSNWDNGALPTGSDNVTINPTAPNMPLVTLTTAAPAVCNNLTINTGTSLTIDAGKALTVNGTLTNNVGISGMVIKSDATGTGSLINNTASVPAKVDRYFTGASAAWHLISSPVAAQAISPDFTATTATDYDFYSWYEPAVTWVNFKNTTTSPTWNTANGSTNFTVGKGYLVEYLGTNITKQFQGNLNTGVVSYMLSKTGGSTYTAYNLVGNPYASAIDWKAPSGWTRSFVVMNSGGYDMSIWNDAVGNYGSFNSAGFSGTNGVTQFIPVGQGFMVKAAASGAFGMDNAVRVHDNQAWIKSTEEISNILRMKVSGNVNTYSDEIVIEFGHQDATGGAEKMFSFYETAPSMNTVKPTGDYSVDFRGEPTAMVIPVSFRAGADGYYTMTASQLESFTSSTMITLEDIKEAKTQNLMQNPVYTFSSTKNDEEARFLLHFGGTFSLNDKDKDQPVNIYSSGNSVYISNTSGTMMKGRVTVYNMIGQILKQQLLSETPLTRINLSGSTGYYLVKVVTGENTYTEKVFIN